MNQCVPFTYTQTHTLVPWQTKSDYSVLYDLAHTHTHTGSLRIPDTNWRTVVFTIIHIYYLYDMSRLVTSIHPKSCVIFELCQMYTYKIKKYISVTWFMYLSIWAHSCYHSYCSVEYTHRVMKTMLPNEMCCSFFLFIILSTLIVTNP